MRIRRYVVLLALLAAAPPSAAAQDQNGSVTGLVTDRETGQPMAGVQISLTGTRLGQVTNENGRYLLASVPAGSYTVSAQYLGYSEGVQRNVQVTTGSTATVDFELAQTVLTLEEVVVTGVTDPIAGVKVPFSVGRVSKENLKSVPTTASAAASIQGKVAGVSIVRGTGQPGEGVSVQLRTPTSYYGSTSPLYVVDGVIMGSTFGGTTADLEALNIESIEVVKGAAAASLYGSRAASGVISIQTSRGRDLGLNQTRIQVRSEFGQSVAPTGLPRSETHYFKTNAQGQFVNAAGGVAANVTERVVDDDNIMDNPYTTTLYDNVEKFFQPGQFYTNNVSLSHNSASTNFMVSLNNYRERGSLTGNDGYGRNSLQFNLDHRLAENFSLTASAFHSRSKSDDIESSFFDLFLYQPEVDLGRRDENGGFIQLPDPTVLTENPLWDEQVNFNTDRRARTLLSLDSRFTPFAWLSFDGTMSYDRSDRNSEEYTPKGTPTSITQDIPSDGFLRLDNNYTDVVNASGSANLTFNLAALNARTTLRGLMEREKNRTARAEGTDFFVVGVPDLSVAATREIESGLDEIRANGLMVQQGIDYAGKYIGDFLVRRDGSSLFGADARWSTYYRAALSYRLSQEPWWPIPALNEFKLRASRGTAGGRPQFAWQYESWTVNENGQVGKENLGNRDLKPEHTTETEFGVDMIALNRYSLELTYAQSVTKDQLVAAPLPSFFGYINQYINAGQISGHTYEATLQAQLINRPDLTWQTTLVADRSRSKIDSWPRSCFFDDTRNVCGGAGLGEMWGERLLTAPGQLPALHTATRDQFQLNDDGYLVWVGDGVSYRDGLAQNLWGTSGDVDGRTYQWGEPILDVDSLGFPIQQQIGNSDPDFSVGWLNNVNWQGFAVHAHMHAQVGGNVYNATRQRMYQHQRHADLDQSAKESELKKPLNYYQRIYNTNNNTSDFVEDGTFVKLRALSVLYRFNREQLSHIGLGRFTENLAIGIVGRNLLTLDRYTGFDPEVGSVLERIDEFDYPNTRTITATVQVTF